MCLLIRFLCFFFFFSSRRRHTRLTCDWSSDVCSSDLGQPGAGAEADPYPGGRRPGGGGGRAYRHRPARWPGIRGLFGDPAEIGRASCRERVEKSGVAGLLKKKKK